MQRKWKRKWRKAVKLAAPLTAGVLLWLSVSAYANPSGASVASGAVSVVSQGAAMVVNQQSSKAIINWQSFNIGRGESVRFVQPSASAVALNRIVGSEASSIYGSLSANGKIFLVNPNGIYFRPGSQVSVGGLVASSLNISDQDFLAGRYHFSKNDSSSASVSNSGVIQAAKEAVLIGSTAANEGLIAAKVTALGAGGQVSLSFTNDDLVSLTVDTKAVDGKVTNRGTITADGGLVVMSAGTKDALMRTVVNNSGLVQANSVGEKQGTIYFSGDTVINRGTITARGESGQSTGGTVTLLGGTIRLENESVVDVSGQGGGGTAVIGNWQAETVTAKETSVIRADALHAGSGGTVSLIGQTASAGGTISAVGQGSGKGGAVETSGEKLDISGGKVNVAGGSQGKGGNWLLDPYDMNIDASGASAISTALGSGGNVKVQTGIAGSSASNGATSLSTSMSGTDGDININSAISWAGSGGTLTLDAYHSINVNANITASGTNAGVNLITNDTAGAGTSASGSGKLTFGSGSLTFSGTSPNLTINGQGYTIVNNLGSIGASGYYALGTDVIDTGTRTGAVQASFSGALEGLGHTISNLTISSAGGTNVGLFGTIASGGSVSNLTIKDASVTGQEEVGVVAGVNQGTLYHVGVSGTSNVSGNIVVGGLVGENDGSISNSYNSGSVSGAFDVGGLAGANNEGSISASYNSGRVSGGDYVGGLVGYDGGGSISASYNSGRVSGGDYVGGLVGYNVGGSISASYNSGSVSGGTYVGGLAGYNGGGSISASYNSGSVSGGTKVGGLAGANNEGSISNSYNSGSVRSTGDYAGGLVGFQYRGNISASYNSGSVSGNSTVGGLVGYYHLGGGSISNSYNSGSVSGDKYVGGLVGVNEGSISASYNSGSVSGGTYVGGLVGYNGGSISDSYNSGSVSGWGGVGGLVGANFGSISASYNSGSVSGGVAVGGLVGNNFGPGSISVSYWNKERVAGGKGIGSDSNSTAGTSALTTSQMTSGTSLYNGFDFTNTWYQNGTVNGGYPILRSSPFVVTVSVNNGSTITYGDSPLNYSNLWPGDTAEILGMASQTSLSGGSTSSSGYLNAGTQTVTPVVTGSYTSANGGTKAYTIIQESGTVIVNPKPINYTVANATGTYGTVATTGGVTLTGTISGDSVVGTVGVQNNTGGTVSSLTTATNAGTYTESVTSLSNANYTIAASGNQNGTLTIAQKPINYTVANGTGTYGSATAGSVTLSGVINSDSVTGTVGVQNNTGGTVSSLTTATNAGTYTESVTGLSNPNYSIATIGNANGTLTIVQKPINYTVANATGTYGSATAGSVTLSGTISGDSVVGTVGVQNNTGGTVSSLTTTTPVGTYTESVTGLSNANYTIATSGNANGTLTIVATPPPPPSGGGDVTPPIVNPTPTPTPTPTTSGSGGSVTSVTPAPLPVTPTPGGSSGTGGTVGSLGTVMAAIGQLVGALQQEEEARSQMGRNGGTIRSLRRDGARNFDIEGSGIQRSFKQQLEPAELQLMANSLASSSPSGSQNANQSGSQLISQSTSQSGGQVASLTSAAVTVQLEPTGFVVTMRLSGDSLSSEIKAALDDLLAVSRERPAIVFSMRASATLSDSSSQAVVEYLTSRGLDSRRLQSIDAAGPLAGIDPTLSLGWTENAQKTSG